MMDDHADLSRVRISLTEALMVLLNPEIMKADDFQKAKEHAMQAVALLHQLQERSRDK